MSTIAPPPSHPHHINHLLSSRDYISDNFIGRRSHREAIAESLGSEPDSGSRVVVELSTPRN